MPSLQLRDAVEFVLRKHDPRVKQAFVDEISMVAATSAAIEHRIETGLARPWTTKELDAARRRAKRWERNKKNAGLSD